MQQGQTMWQALGVAITNPDSDRGPGLGRKDQKPKHSEGLLCAGPSASPFPATLGRRKCQTKVGEL